jgi:hypothetical protein
LRQSVPGRADIFVYLLTAPGAGMMVLSISDPVSVIDGQAMLDLHHGAAQHGQVSKSHCKIDTWGIDAADILGAAR